MGRRLPSFWIRGTDEQSCDLAVSGAIGDRAETRAGWMSHGILPILNDLKTVKHALVVPIGNIADDAAKKQEIQRPKPWIVPPESVTLIRVTEDDAFDAANGCLVDVEAHCR